MTLRYLKFDWFTHIQQENKNIPKKCHLIAMANVPVDLYICSNIFLT